MVGRRRRSHYLRNLKPRVIQAKAVLGASLVGTSVTLVRLTTIAAVVVSVDDRIVTGHLPARAEQKEGWTLIWTDQTDQTLGDGSGACGSTRAWLPLALGETQTNLDIHFLRLQTRFPS